VVEMTCLWMEGGWNADTDDDSKASDIATAALGVREPLWLGVESFMLGGDDKVKRGEREEKGDNTSNFVIEKAIYSPSNIYFLMEMGQYFRL
jgi:hypothetical protein